MRARDTISRGVAARPGLWFAVFGLVSSSEIGLSATGFAQTAEQPAIHEDGSAEKGQPKAAEQAQSETQTPALAATSRVEATKAPFASVAPIPTAKQEVTRNAPAQRNGSRSYYRSIIEREAAHTGLPPDVAEAVMEVESGFNPALVGAAGEIGLMQLMPPTARMLGFSGTLSALAAPETNIHYGVRYLAQAWRLAGGDVCTATMKYRAGHGETRFSQLSVHYCLAVRSRLAARGYPVVGVVPVATFGGAASGGIGFGLSRPFKRLSIGGAMPVPPRLSLDAPAPCRSRCLAALDGRQLNFDGINNSLNHLVLQSNVRAIRLR